MIEPMQSKIKWEGHLRPTERVPATTLHEAGAAKVDQDAFFRRTKDNILVFDVTVD